MQRQNKRTEEHKGEFKRVSWDDAFNDITEKLTSLREKYGPNAVAFFNGNPAVFDSRAVTTTLQMIAGSGTKMVFGSGTQDTTNKFRGAYDIYGVRSLPFPDFEHTNYLLCLGANPKISHWTLTAQPNDSIDCLKKIKARGGKCVFVNPRKTESSMPETGETLLIKPGTDVYFLAAVINEIAENNDINYDHVDKYGKNLAGLLSFVKQYPAAKVSKITGIDADDIKTVAADFVAADGAAVFMSTGIAQSGQGLLTHWLSEMLNFITGNLGRKGGSFIPNGLIKKPMPVDVSKLPKFMTSLGEMESTPPGIALPAVLLPDFIESGEIKAIIILAANPILSVGGEHRMRKAFEKLDLIVATDIMLNASGELADYVLPSASWVERADINFIGSGSQGGTPHIHYTDAMEAPSFERKEDWRIIAKLSQALGVPSLLDQTEEARQDGFVNVNNILADSDLSIDKLKMMPQQVFKLPKIAYEDFYKTWVLHSDKKVECFPPAYQASGLLQRCADMFDELENEPEGNLKLVSLRTNHMHNTWMSNVQRLRKGSLERNPLHMNPVDAQARNLFDGDEIRVFNQHGDITTVLRVSDNMRPGAVAMSHGYSKDNNQHASMTSELRGSNCNQLMPSAGDSFEPLSNMSRLCAVNVDVAIHTPEGQS